MKTLRTVALAVSVGLCLGSLQQAAALPIVEQLASNSTSNAIPGQSLTTPAGGPWNNLQFNWFNSAGDAIAFGTLYILTQEYSGEPGGLGGATPGFVTSALPDGPGAVYLPPDPIIELLPSTTYFFYTDAVPPDPIKVATTDPLALGRAYEAASPFVAVPGSDFAFSLQGTEVPEPSTFALTALGLLSLRLWRKHRRT